MAHNMNKIIVVFCLAFIAIVIILIKSSGKTNNLWGNVKETNNVTAKNSTPKQRQLKSLKVDNSQTDSPATSRQLTKRAKRFIERHAANVRDFNSQQLDRLYERLGFG